MRYFMQHARDNSPDYHRIFDTATGLVYHLHVPTQTLQVWSLHNGGEGTLKFDGASTLPFWNALLASATHIDPPPHQVSNPPPDPLFTQHDLADNLNATIIFHHLPQIQSPHFPSPATENDRIALALAIDHFLRHRAPAAWRTDTTGWVDNWLIRELHRLLNQDDQAAQRLFILIRNHTTYGFIPSNNNPTELSPYPNALTLHNHLPLIRSIKFQCPTDEAEQAALALAIHLVMTTRTPAGWRDDINGPRGKLVLRELYPLLNQDGDATHQLFTIIVQRTTYGHLPTPAT